MLFGVHKEKWKVWYFTIPFQTFKKHPHIIWDPKYHRGDYFCYYRVVYLKKLVMMVIKMITLIYHYLFHCLDLFRILHSCSFVLQWKISHYVQIALKDTSYKFLQLQGSRCLKRPHLMPCSTLKSLSSIWIRSLPSMSWDSKVCHQRFGNKLRYRMKVLTWTTLHPCLCGQAIL